jgi:hypothetical protein
LSLSQKYKSERDGAVQSWCSCQRASAGRGKRSETTVSLLWSVGSIKKTNFQVTEQAICSEGNRIVGRFYTSAGY